MIHTINCKFCNKVIESNRRDTKFCNGKCFCNWKYQNDPVYKEKILKNSREFYLSNKDNSEYKERQKKIFSSWVDRNREHYNKMMSKLVMKSINKRKAEYRKNKLCTGCGRKRAEDRLYCQHCIDMRLTRKARKLKAGLCSRCGKIRENIKIEICNKCKAKMAINCKKWKQRQIEKRRN